MPIDPLTAFTHSSGPSLDSLISKHVDRTGLDPELVRRLVGQESRGRTNAVSPKGAGGVGQLMPATAKSLGVRNVFDPDENLRGSTDYLKQQLDKFGDVNLALAAYNAGPGAVIKHGNKVPPYTETQNYVKKIGSGYQGTGYAQDPLTAFTQGKPAPSDPLSTFTQPDVEPQKPTFENIQSGMRGSEPALSTNDAAWHFGMTPDEAKRLPPKARDVLAEAVAEDLRKKNAGQTIQRPSLKYQNEMRKAAGLKPLKFNVVTDEASAAPYYQSSAVPFSINEKPSIQIKPRPFTFSQPSDAQIKASIRSQVASESADAEKAWQARPQGGGIAPRFDVDAETERRFKSFQDERSRTVDYARRGPRFEGRNDPEERARAVVGDLIQKYAPILASQNIDTPGGLKTDALRGALSAVNVIPGPQAAILNRISQPREISSEEKLLNPQAEAEQELRRGVGQAAASFIPLVGAGKLISAAGVASPALRDMLTFGLAEAGKQLSQTGTINPETLTETMVTGGVMGRIAGVDPSLKRRLVAYIAPQLALSVAKGEKPDQILQSATQNALFALAGGHEQEAKAPTQTVPDVLQGKLRGGEIDTALRTRETAVRPPTQASEVPAMRVAGRLRGAQPIELPQAKYPDTKYPESLGVVGPTKPVEGIEEGARLNRWQHRNFGLVTETADQSNVTKGRVRVVDEKGNEHIIQRSNGRGEGNNIAVPVKSDARAEDEAAQAKENAPFKVVDRRIGLREGVNEPNTVTRTSGEPSSQPEILSTGERTEPQIRHVDVQARRVKNVATGNKGQFKTESKSERESRQAQVNPTEQAATTPSVSPQREAAQPVSAETTASTPAKIIAERVAAIRPEIRSAIDSYLDETNQSIEDATSSADTRNHRDFTQETADEIEPRIQGRPASHTEIEDALYALRYEALPDEFAPFAQPAMASTASPSKPISEATGEQRGQLSPTEPETVNHQGENDLSKAQNGKPITVTVHHGTPDARFAEEFDPNKKGYYSNDPDALPDNETFIGLHGGIRQGFKNKKGGIFFSDDPKVAESYANDRRAFDYQNAVPMTLTREVSLQNPKVIDWGGMPWRGTEAVIKQARDEGYDGIIIKNVRDVYSTLEGKTRKYPNAANNVVVFDTKTIKPPEAAENITGAVVDGKFIPNPNYKSAQPESREAPTSQRSVTEQISYQAKRQQVVEALARDEFPYKGWDKDFPDLAAERLASQEAPKTTETKEASSAKPPTTTGIARRVEESRRAELGQEPPPKGGGISAADSVVRGRELLAKGLSPEQVVSDFQKNGQISADAMALVRAKHEELARAANQAFDEGGQSLNSPKFKAAEKTRQEFWEKSVKPMQTEWHKTGMAQQGETNIDTGTFYGMYRAFKQHTGKEMTPEQAVKAKELAKNVSEVDAKVRQTSISLAEELDKAAGLKDLPSDVQSSIQRLVDAEKPTRAERRQRTKKTIDDEFASLKAQMAAAKAEIKSSPIEYRQGGLGLPSFDPSGKLTPIIVKMAKNRIKAGIVDTVQLVDSVHTAAKEFADVTRREVAEIIAGLRNAPRDKKGKSEWQTAKSEVGKGLKAEDAQKSFEDLRNRMTNGEKPTPEDARAIWLHMRKYVDRGMEFPDARYAAATDLGASPEQIARAITQQPKAKRLSDQMYKQMSDRRNAIAQNEAWVKSADTPVYRKFISTLPDFWFGLKTFGHGTVGMVTHAGKNIFLPTRWAEYFPNFVKQYGLAVNKGYHERMMQDLQNSPNFIEAKRAGLANDPHRTFDDYQKNSLAKLFGRAGLAGARGFDSLKLLRQDLFDAHWNKMPDSLKTPQMAELLATEVNHSTGAMKINLPKSASTVFFAPRLEASRWAWVIGDNVKAGKTFVEWKRSSPEERYHAKMVAKRDVEFVATYTALLALNQGVLIAANSKDRVNLTDPTKADWMRFKVLGRTVEPSGGLISMLDFMGKMGNAAFGARDPREGRFEKAGKATMQYGRGKLSPIASTATDVLTQSDFAGRPLPFSSDKGTVNRPRYGWPEYLITQQTPIPVGEAARDAYKTMKDRGMDESVIRAIFQGAAVGTLSGGTGVRIGEEFHINPRPQGRVIQ